MKERPEVLKGTTKLIKLECGHLYIIINFDKNKKPFEVFLKMGKVGGCAASQLEAISRLISLALRCDIALEEIIDQLDGIRCPNSSISNGKEYYSCSDCVAKILKELK